VKINQINILFFKSPAGQTLSIFRNDSGYSVLVMKKLYFTLSHEVIFFLCCKILTLNDQNVVNDDIMFTMFTEGINQERSSVSNYYYYYYYK